MKRIFGYVTNLDLAPELPNMNDFAHDQVRQIVEERNHLVEFMLRKHMLQDMATPQQLAKAGYSLIYENHDDGKQVVKLVKVIDEISHFVKIEVEEN